MTFRMAPSPDGDVHMKYGTALRSETVRRIEDIGSAEILVGIPTYNNQETIAHVVQTVTEGLATHYGDLNSVILIADGGSTDDTREVAGEVELGPRQEKVVSIYRGLAGKGTALRSVFEAADRLRVKACAMVDSDLRSITPDWVKFLVQPVLEKDYQFVAPVYARHKYDGTITNHVVYNLTRTLYGKRIRQPIGGDFAISGDVARFYSGQDVWETDVARFGIDIWMTTGALARGLRVCQSNLGVKIHDVKDPGEHLGPMFRQVLGVLFSLMEQYESTWKRVQGSRPVPVFGLQGSLEPESVSVNLEGMIERFQRGYGQFSSLWREVFSATCFDQIRASAEMDRKQFHLPTQVWIKVLYELAAAFHRWGPNRVKLLEPVTPLYLARVASFVRQTWEMSSRDAEALVEEQAEEFERQKGYLISVWEEAAGEKTSAES
jgi:hypothetical protein